MNVYIKGHTCTMPLLDIVHAMTNQSVKLCVEHDFTINYVYSEYIYRDGISVVITTIFDNNKLKSMEYIPPVGQTMNNVVKIGYYLLAREFYRKSLPWGTHTGIRPAKIASQYLSKGEDYAKNILTNNFYISNEKASLAIKVAKKEYQLLKKQPPLGVSLYIGIPFCPTRCLYCSFVSLPVTKQLKYVQPYLDHLISEIRYTANIINELNIPIDSIYIGGGTPTTFSAKQLDSLLCSVTSNFNLSHLPEFTLEAGRPDTINDDKLSVITNHPITRISINPQTLNDEVLKIIGRQHTARDFDFAYNLAIRHGITNINTDIIAGLPGESYSMFISSLVQLLKYSGKSVTMHTMCVKRASTLKTDLYDEHTSSAQVSQMIEDGSRILIENGLSPYYLYRQKDTLDNLENTGFSKDGYECMYNIIMMQDLSTVIAMGAGSVTKMVDAKANKIERVFNLKDPHEYINKFDEILKRKDITQEYLHKIYKEFPTIL